MKATTHPTKRFGFPCRPPTTPHAHNPNHAKHAHRPPKNHLSGFHIATYFPIPIQSEPPDPHPPRSLSGFRYLQPTTATHATAPARWAVLRQCGRENPIYHLTVITVDGSIGFKARSADRFRAKKVCGTHSFSPINNKSHNLLFGTKRNLWLLTNERSYTDWHRLSAPPEAKTIFF